MQELYPQTIDVNLTQIMVPTLFSPVQVGPYALANRIVMAPMTRSRAGPGNAPTAMNATYYAQRASAGLIVSEGTQVSPQGVGYPGTPGIHSAEQIAGWKLVTEAVHANGGRIFLQLWHVGRISHPTLQPDGALPVAPSAIRPEGKLWTGAGMLPFETPRALAADEIPGIVESFRIGAANALAAGCDGVEIHAANGYLIDQFLRDKTNRRTDRYGGSMENRVAIVREIVEKTRYRVGSDFAIIIKLNCDDGPVDDGFKEEIDIRTFPRVAMLVEKAGVDAIDVSGHDPIRTGIEDPKEQSYYKAYTARLDGLKIPVILSGGNRDVELLEDLYRKQDGNIDFYAFARPLIRQPNLIKQWLEGGDAKSECINVSLCFRAMAESPPRTAHCVVLERLRQAQEEATAQLRSGEPGIFGA